MIRVLSDSSGLLEAHILGLLGDLDRTGRGRLFLRTARLTALPTAL
jgi:hypothetical protein